MKTSYNNGLMAAALVCLFSFTPGVAGAASSRPAKADPTVLAHVNDDEITIKQMLAVFTNRHGGHAKFLGGKEEARNFLDIMIEDRLFIQEAYLIGLDDDPTAKALVREFGNSKASALLIKREIEEKSKPSTDEIKAIWQNELRTVRRVQQIVVDRKQEAEEIRVSLVSGVEFESLARSCSVDASGRNGGNLIVGWGRMDPEWERVVFPLEPGDLSPVIETKDGYEIILVVDRLDSDEVRPEFDKVSKDIEGILSTRKLDARKAEFSGELWARYGAVVQPIDLAPAALLRTLESSPETVVAKWDGGELTLKELADAGELRGWEVLPPRKAAVEVDTRLRATVNGELVILEANNRKLADEPELAAEIETYEDLVVESLLFRDKIFRTLTVTDEEGREYFEEHRDEFKQPEERHVAHILVPTEADAARVRAEIAAGAEFGDVAKTNSRDFASALSGGDLGWITEQKVPPSFKEVLSMSAGDLSKPMKSESGWHIVKLLEIRPSRLREYDEVKDKLKESALDAKKRETRKFWIGKLRAAATIEIYDDHIDKFVKANEMTSSAAPAPQHEVPAGEIRPH